MQLLPPGTAPFPSKCIVCGTVQRPLIMFDVVQDWTGRLLICNECLADAATKYVNVTDVAPAGLVREQLQTIAYYKAREDGITNALNTFQEMLAHASREFDRGIVRAIESVDHPISILDLQVVPLGEATEQRAS
jgi:hypothetical protein